MDLADIGTETTERRTAAAIRAVQVEAQKKIFPFIGRCYNCEATLKDRPFCDTECREDYISAQQRIGRR